jgi:hypothetical protein
MFQTILGVAILLVGLAGLVFNQRLASSHRDFTRWAFGLETSFARDGGRAGFILAGLDHGPAHRIARRTGGLSRASIWMVVAWWLSLGVIFARNPKVGQTFLSVFTSKERIKTGRNACPT